jgi:hypothetical protein
MSVSNAAFITWNYKFGEFNVVLCLDLIYHFRYPQYIIDYLSTLKIAHLFISTQTHPRPQLSRVNRREPSVLPSGFLSEDIVLTGLASDTPTVRKDVTLDRIRRDNPAYRPVDRVSAEPPGLTNSACYRATRVRSTDPEVAKRQFYPR